MNRDIVSIKPMTCAMQCRRARQARTELLAQHCVVRAGCMRIGDNMVGSLTTEFPFLLPGVASNRQGGSIVPND